MSGPIGSAPSHLSKRCHFGTWAYAGFHFAERAKKPASKDAPVCRLHAQLSCHMQIPMRRMKKTTSSLQAAAPWRDLGWGLLFPLVFAGNVVVATLAWIIVGWVMR
jgi:hypothetical protein